MAMIVGICSALNNIILLDKVARKSTPFTNITYKVQIGNLWNIKFPKKLSYFLYGHLFLTTFFCVYVYPFFFEYLNCHFWVMYLCSLIIIYYINGCLKRLKVFSITNVRVFPKKTIFFMTARLMSHLVSYYHIGQICFLFYIVVLIIIGVTLISPIFHILYRIFHIRCEVLGEKVKHFISPRPTLLLFYGTLYLFVLLCIPICDALISG